jgi:hypothetical protein
MTSGDTHQHTVELMAKNVARRRKKMANDYGTVMALYQL